MRKLSVLLIVACVLITACGKPSNISQDAYDCGNTALSLVSDYRSGKITKDDAIEKLQVAIDRLDAKYNEEGNTYKTYDLAASIDIAAVQAAIILDNDLDESTEKLRTLITKGK